MIYSSVKTYRFEFGEGQIVAFWILETRARPWQVKRGHSVELLVPQTELIWKQESSWKAPENQVRSPTFLLRNIRENKLLKYIAARSIWQNPLTKSQTLLKRTRGVTCKRLSYQTQTPEVNGYLLNCQEIGS